MGIEIRDLAELSEYHACARLQIDVWGFAEIEVVPAGHLVAMHHYGGVCIGAFDGDRLIGFVCGFAGWEEGHLFHHSHMLAVLPDYRGRRVGENLKWAQRDRVLDQGIDLVNWTFDPLQAPNANLNLNRLGGVVRKYKVNLYGVSESPLHGGIPTDRFEVEWHLQSQRVLDARDGAFHEFRDWEALPRANRTRRTSAGWLACEQPLDLDVDTDRFLVEVPRTITDLMAEDPELALDWRYQSRTVFQAYFAKGFRVEGLHRTPDSAFYRLARVEEPTD